MPWFDEALALSLVREAVRLGADLCDTGPTYSAGNAELRLGRAIRELDQRPLVSTKVGTHLNERGKLYKDYSPVALERSLTRSLARLGTGAVDMLLVHGPLCVADVTDELYDALLRMRSRGLAHLVGSSCDGEVARRIAEDGVVDVLMTTYSDLDMSNRPAIARAAANGMHVLAKSPMGTAGRVFPRRPLLSRPAAWYNARMLVRHPRLTMMATYRALCRTADRSGLSFAADDRDVSCVVVGTTNPDHLRANARTVIACRAAWSS